MKKIWNLFIVTALVGGIVGCGNTTGQKEESTLPEVEAVSDTETMDDEKSEELKLLAGPYKLGFCPKVGDEDYNTSRFNLTGRLFAKEGKAFLKLSVVDLKGNEKHSADLMDLKTGAAIKMNAAQTEFTFSSYTDELGEKVVLQVSSDNYDPDVKISNRNKIFKHTNDACSIVGSDDARDNITNKVTKLNSILGDLNDEQVIAVHFEPINAKSGYLYFSNKKKEALFGPKLLCSKTEMVVWCWGKEFNVKADKCDKAQK